MGESKSSMRKALVFSGYRDHRHPGWSALMAATFAQACRDTKSDDPMKALDAALWLASPDAETLVYALGWDNDPLDLLISGRIRKLKKI